MPLGGGGEALAVQPVKGSLNIPNLMKDSALSKYQQLTADREDFLDTARECAALSLPYLLTDEGHTQGGSLRKPWQSQGAKGRKRAASS